MATKSLSRIRKKCKALVPINTNHTERTHRYFNAFMLWNDSLVKFVSLFLERSLKHKTKNRNLRHKLERPKLLLTIQHLLIDLVYRFALLKYNSKTKAFFNSTIQVNLKSQLELWRGQTSRIIAWSFENSLPLFLQYWVSHNWKSISSEISIERGNK